MPKFGLAIPSWVWYLGFFVVPVLVIVWYSFGYKPPVNAGQGPIGTDRLSLAELSRRAFRHLLQDVPEHAFESQ